MLKNIAEKIDLLEQKRTAESSDWRSDIEQYKEEITLRREEDMAMLEDQLAELDKKRLEEAAEYEKREMTRRDSIRNSKLENEIQALRDMLAVNTSDEKLKAKELDSSRFAMLDNELQSLRKMLLQAMLQDSIEAKNQAQEKIEAELAELDEEFSAKFASIEGLYEQQEQLASQLEELEAQVRELDQEAEFGLLSVISGAIENAEKLEQNPASLAGTAGVSLTDFLPAPPSRE